ncbi:MAG TPA: hypothetical protein VGJ60_07425 [Chloroflexota bacterium]|jgi:hypothetical protein
MSPRRSSNTPHKNWVPADQEDPVVKVEENETIYYPESQHSGRSFARPKCDLNEGRWYCATHRERFDNQMQKDIHIEQHKHRLAWLCFEHGFEVP